LNILWLAPNLITKRNWGHQLFRNEFANQHNVIYYGRKFKDYDPLLSDVRNILSTRCKKKKIDVIMTYGPTCKEYKGLGEVKNIIKVHFLLDYNEPIKPEHAIFEKNIQTHNNRIINHGYDMVFTFTTKALDTLRKSKIIDPKMTEFFPFSVDTNRYKKMNLKKIHDVMAVYTVKPLYYPHRGTIRKILSKMDIKVDTRKITNMNLIKGINQAKIIVTNNNYYGSLSMRYTETLACGGFLLADKPADTIGLKHKEHLVFYDGMNDFQKKVRYYLSHDKERNEIANNGMQYVRKYHSCKVRVRQITDFIKERTGIK